MLTGKDIKFDIQSITLDQVFELELHNHIDKVDEICQEASEEQKNANKLAAIDQYWKSAEFLVNEYTKAGVVRGFVLSAMDEVKTKLEED